jgi:L-ribulose-5-phosphate 3-epimerase UlaE
MGFDYFAVLNMPVYERKIYIDMWQKEMEEQQKQYNKAKSKRR